MSGRAPAQRIVLALKGRWYGGYGVAPCVAHRDRNPSLKLSDGETGALLVHCYAGCAPADILAELRRRGLLDDGNGGTGHRPRRQPARRSAGRRDAEQDRHRRQREESAIAIWRASRVAAGTPVEAYLRTRGITASIPPSIRFHPDLKHGPTGLPMAAMVAAVQGPDRRIVGVHRTYLLPNGRAKAQVREPKLSLGPISGGAARLAAAGHHLAVGEGIETCLSFMQATGTATWAALSTAGLVAIVLPPLPLAAVVIIAMDVDQSGAGERAALAAADRLAREGREVVIASPAAGGDFNDAVRLERAA